MAIGYARVEFVKRSSGKNACAKAAYNSRSEINFEGNKVFDPESFDWSRKEKPFHHEVLLPKGVHEKFKKPEVLWNAVEARETKRNAQVAIELVMALPDDKVITPEDRVLLAKSFVQAHFVDKGLAAQVDIHKPERRIEITRDNKELGLSRGMSGHLVQDKKDLLVLELENGARVQFSPAEFTGFIEKEHNWHAHVLATTRRFNENGTELGEKARDLMPRINKGKVIAGPDWGKLWTQHQNAYFEERGINLRVDQEGIVPQEHLGPVRMRGRAFALFQEHGRRLEANALQSLRPEKILDKITENKSVFTREDVDLFLQKHVDASSLVAVREAFWKQDAIEHLVDKSSGQALGKFSSKKVVEEERTILRIADRLHEKNGPRISPLKAERFIDKLSEEQKGAVSKLIQSGKLACVHGYAGTGKSYLLSAINKIYEDAGYHVRAFGPDSATVDVLKTKGFDNAENVYRFLFALRHDRRKIQGKEVWIFDETSKLGNRPFLEFIREADKRGAKVIFSGDYAQLPPVERGGMFKVLCERYPSVTLEEVQRQRTGKYKEIAKGLASGEFGKAIDKLCSTQSLQWSSTQKGAIEALIGKWAHDTQTVSQDSTLIIAHTNAEVRVLNEVVRIIRKQRGELGPREFACETDSGKIYVSVGDRIEFRKNDKGLGVSNGLSGTLIEAEKDKFVVSIKEAGKRTQLVAFDPREYHAYKLGYASTFYRAQGHTVNRAYVLHSPYMNKEMFYVGLTRHIEEVSYFVSKEDVRNLSELKSQSIKKGSKETTLTFATFNEIQSQQRADQRATEIRNLKESPLVKEVLKGYGLSIMDQALSKAYGLGERIKDKLPNRAFYKPNIVTNRGYAAVEEVSAELVMKTGIGEVSSNTSSMIFKEALPSPPPSTIEKREQAMTESYLTRRQKAKSTVWNAMTQEKQEAIRSYFTASEKATMLAEVIRVEMAGSSDPAYFKEWQKACGARNTEAFELTQRVSKEELASLLGEKFVKIAEDQASRYLTWREKEKGRGVNIEERLKDHIEPLLYRLFPEGVHSKDRRGLRFGAKGSLSVVCAGTKAGHFFDFERQEGGGLLQLVQRELGLGRLEAQGWAKDFLGIAQEIKVPQAFTKITSRIEKEGEWVSLIPDTAAPAPKLDELCEKKLQRYYTEDTRHAYRDEQGQLLYYTLRLRDKADSKRKITPPLSYGYWKSNPNAPRWELKGFQEEKRSLYNLHLLRENPTATVLVVEGEKTADAALHKFPDRSLISITWPGGSGAVSRADWAPLAGRKVIVWPDNDQAGRQAGALACHELRKVGVSSLHMVDPEILQKRFPEKWDLADPLPEGVVERDLSQLLSNSLNKGIDPKQIVNRVSSLSKDNPIDVMKANEILWRVDERMRADLEKQHESQYRKVHDEIIKEATRILVRKEEWAHRLINELGIKAPLVERLTSLAMAHEAKHGKSPTIEQLQLFKESVCAISFVPSKGMNRELQEFSLDKVLMSSLENASVGERDKNRLNAMVLASSEGYAKQMTNQQRLEIDLAKQGLEKGRGLSL